MKVLILLRFKAFFNGFQPDREIFNFSLGLWIISKNFQINSIALPSSLEASEKLITKIDTLASCQHEAILANDRDDCEMI